MTGQFPIHDFASRKERFARLKRATFKAKTAQMHAPALPSKELSLEEIRTRLKDECFRPMEGRTGDAIVAWQERETLDVQAARLAARIERLMEEA